MISTYETTDTVGFKAQRDAAAFGAACQVEETLLQFVGSAVNPFSGALDVLVFLCIRSVRYDAAFGNLRILAINIHHATRKQSAMQNVFEAEMLSTCYDMSSCDTAVLDVINVHMLER